MSLEHTDSIPASTADSPDLDWSQIRETVRILQAAAIHIELAMSGGDDSIGTLVESFSTIADHAEQIQNTLNSLRDQQACDAIDPEEIERTGEILMDMRTRSSIAIEAFQFYDRLWQKLNSLISGLEETSNLIADPKRLYSPMAWRALQGELRESMNMEEDRVLFDAIMAGRSRAEAVEIAMLQKENDEKAKQEDDDVDFF